ncbi:MAG: TfoX/Sxy family protein [Leptospirales bacterium]|nr:TfoX/Sxy family protein [Leptospirales bacterium]
MPYDEKLATRVRSLLPAKDVEEKKMMGGLTFMLKGKMCVGILKDELMVRLDPDLYDVALAKKGCHEMNFTGRPMKGFVFVNPDGTGTKKDLEYWIGIAVAFNKNARASRKSGKARARTIR